jgi:hypothetical protein
LLPQAVLALGFSKELHVVFLDLYAHLMGFRLDKFEPPNLLPPKKKQFFYQPFTVGT